MSDASESKPLLDLSDLRLMPKWVTDFRKAPPQLKPDDESESADSDRGRQFRDDRGRDRDRRSGPPRGGQGFGGQRQGQGYGQGKGGPGPRQGDRGPRPGGSGRQGDRDGRSGPGQDRRGRPYGDQRHGNDRDRDRRGGPRQFSDAAPVVIQNLVVTVEPESKATEAMAAMIRNAGKAYSVFDAARLVLASGDRFHAKFVFPKDGPQKLYAIPADGSLWLSKDEALSQFLHGEGLQEFYREEKVELEEPKGNFNSIATCGMSGELLGPPSHHSYQTNLHRLHRERFAHLPFEEYKRRVRTDNTPEAVAKWKEAQKHGVQWVYLGGTVNEGEEPKRFKSRSEMEAHFRSTHAENLVHETHERYIVGNLSKKLLSPALYQYLRRAVDDARRHLLQTAQQLCIGFEQHGLKLFKRRGGKLWVSRTRPRVLDASVVLSDRVAQIVEIVRAKPGISVKDLMEVVAPHEKVAAEITATPVEALVEEVVSAPALVAVPPVEDGPAPDVTEGDADVAPVQPALVAELPTQPDSEVVAPTAEEAASEPQAPAAQVGALKDLHWLNSEGYIIEYADGVVFLGVTEPPPAKPKAPREPKVKQPAEGEVPPAETETGAAAPVSGEGGEIPSEAAPEVESATDAVAETPAAEVETPVAEATEAEVVPTSEEEASSTDEKAD